MHYRSDKISNIIPGTINLMESSASFPNINSSDFSFHQVEKPTSNRVIINDNERITRNTEQAKITRSKQRDQMNKNNYR